MCAVRIAPIRTSCKRYVDTHESKPSPSASSVRSNRLRRPAEWSARSSDHRVAWIPTLASGSGGNGSDRLRTIFQFDALARSPVEQIEADIGGEPCRAYAEAGEALT